MRFIIKSSNKKEPNWSGKEFSDLPAKIYFSHDDAFDAIKHYWFGSYNLVRPIDNRQITLVPITHEQSKKLIEAKKARL